MSVGLEIGSKQKVLLKNSYLTFFWDDPLSRNLSRVIRRYRYLSRKLVESFLAKSMNIDVCSIAFIGLGEAAHLQLSPGGEIIEANK